MSNEPDPFAPAAQPARDPSTALTLVAPPGERDDRWTRQRQAQFLRELAATHCVSTAARAVGMSRQSAYRLRNRLKDEPFDVAWQCAFRRQYDALAEIALQRAIHGVEVPHFYKGELIHTSRHYDERLTVALLALRQRVAPMPWSREAESEGVSAEDFETLVARVEYGGELWDAPYGPMAEDDADEAFAGSEEPDDDAADAAGGLAQP